LPGRIPWDETSKITMKRNLPEMIFSKVLLVLIRSAIREQLFPKNSPVLQREPQHL
jgi:hypothetical protein